MVRALVRILVTASHTRCILSGTLLSQENIRYLASFLAHLLTYIVSQHA
jgi:hypothetical protein